MLAEREHLNFELQVGIGRNQASGAPGPVGQLRGADNSDMVADGQGADDLVPAFNDLAQAHLEIEGLVALLAGVEDLASCGQGAGLVHGHFVAGLGVLFQVPAIGDLDLVLLHEVSVVQGRRRGEGDNSQEDQGGFHFCNLLKVMLVIIQRGGGRDEFNN